MIAGGRNSKGVPEGGREEGKEGWRQAKFARFVTGAPLAPAHALMTLLLAKTLGSVTNQQPAQERVPGGWQIGAVVGVSTARAWHEEAWVGAAGCASICGGHLSARCKAGRC